MSTRLTRGGQPDLHGDPLDKLVQATKRELLKLRGVTLPTRAVVAVIVHDLDQDTLHMTIGGDGPPQAAHGLLQRAATEAKEAAS